ncbi:hypothetical protein NE865_09557 [Phthorimaea operculella]|nr:hypothetical protein NE865_09557 [Phthorimaea operculella]
MAAKVFSVMLLVAIVSQGYSQTLYQKELPDERVNFISHPLYSRAIAIPQSFLDELLTCHLVYPNGATYEIFPSTSLPDPEVRSDGRSCSAAFVHSEKIEQFSGTYKLEQLVGHRDGSMTLSYQKFHVTISASGVGMPE